MKPLSNMAFAIAGALAGYTPLHSQPKGYRRISRLNRSGRWPRANSYEHARDIAVLLGKSNRPVR